MPVLFSAACSGPPGVNVTGALDQPGVVAAYRGADHAACIVGADVQRHRGAHPFAANDLTDHHTAHRVVGAPAAPVLRRLMRMTSDILK